MFDRFKRNPNTKSEKAPITSGQNNYGAMPKEKYTGPSTQQTPNLRVTQGKKSPSSSYNSKAGVNQPENTDEDRTTLTRRLNNRG